MRAVIFVAATLLIAGCPGTDVLQVGVSNLDPQLTVANSAASRYDTASFTLNQITVVPVDPATQVALGVPLSLLQNPVTVDLNGTGNNLPMIPLNTGSYRVENIVISTILLRDDNPPLVPATCIEGLVDPGVDANLGTADDFSLVPDPRAVTQPLSYEFDQFAADGIATVGTAGGTLTVTVDAQAFIASFEASINCTPSNMNVCGFGSSSYISRNCGNFLVASTFTGDSPVFISFN
ncbi:hypothetical protein ABI59_18675 [Acidobacteria bacterium Mor1]|nr:hypothetical protein ABI59_18675 [Acidobacteria bacterium Mor1]